MEEAFAEPMKWIRGLPWRLALVVAASVCLAGCASLISGVTNKFADDLSTAVLGSTDFDVVADGLPAYLLLVDALVEGNPKDASMLNTAAMLNGSYATGFVADGARKQRFSSKAKDLALRASCLRDKIFCGLALAPFAEFDQAVRGVSRDHIDYMYILASSWAGWIQAHADDFRAVAELPRAQALMAQVIELDPAYADGSPYIYMGVFATFLPAALGGQPDVGRDNFEQAIEISGGRNLYAKAMMAEMYARAVFDRELHDRLIAEVLAADPSAADLTLQNVIAQDLARQLKDSADDFF